MYAITANTIADGHEKVVRLIMSSQDFNDVTTEDKELTFEYPEPVNIHITTPWMEPFKSPDLEFGELSLEEYKKEILIPRPLVDRPGLPDFSYLYVNLIQQYPKGEYNCIRALDGSGKLMRVDWAVGNGHGGGTDQIAYVVNKLVESPTSRRCVVSLFHPEGHPKMDDPPCLNHIQFLLRNGELNMHALFRSNDMLSAWGANAYALMCLQQDVVEKLNAKMSILNRDVHSPVVMGWLETTSISAHIYWKRDHKQLELFKKRWC